MAYVLSSVSGNLISAASAGYAPTNSADVSAIASSYQVVSATATQLYAGTAYVTSVNDAPVSAARAGNAANASLANSAYYDGTGRLISALPDSADVSAIASSYVESGVSSKQDTLYFAYNTADQISSINGSALGGMDEAAVSGIASAYAESAVSSKLDSSASSSFYPADNPSGFISSVDLSDYATTAYVDSSISGFAYESSVSGWTAKQDALTFGYDTADKISSINGSSLAGEGGGLVTAIGTSESGITSLNNSGLVDTAALHSSDYSSLYVQEPLYISASGDSSYIGISGNVGGVDSATCSAIASAYAESAVSSVSGNYYTTANESGYLTAQVQASWSESASASPSYIVDKPDLVDIVAGPGIVVDNPDGNTLRISTEADAETVLWSGTLNTLNSDIECSENLSHFSTIKIFYRLVADSIVQSIGVHEFDPSQMSSAQNVSFGGFYLISNNFYGWWIGRLVVTDGYKVKITNTKNSWGTGSSPTDGTTNYSTVGFIYKIVGVHRIAGGN